MGFRLDSVVTVCEDIKKVIVRSGKIPPEKVDVIYHAILERLRAEGHFVEGKVEREVVGKPTALTA